MAKRVSTVQCLDEDLVGNWADRPIGYGLLRSLRRDAAMKPSAAERLERIFEEKHLDATVARSWANQISSAQRCDETLGGPAH